MEEKTYEFYGVDAKTEWKMGLLFGTAFIVIWVISYFIIYWLWRKYIIGNNFITGHYETKIMNLIFFGSMFLGFLGSLGILKFLGNTKAKKWSIIKQKDKLIIEYDHNCYEILLDDITKVKVYGSSEFRYFTIKDNNKGVRIRVGASQLTPFSRKGDLQILDSFINNELMHFLNKNFTKKDRKLSISPAGTVKLTYTRKEKRTS